MSNQYEHCPRQILSMNDQTKRRRSSEISSSFCYANSLRSWVDVISGAEHREEDDDKAISEPKRSLHR